MKTHIVIHHWGSPKATIDTIRTRHVEEFGWEKIGYHYVVGNGNGIPDGRVIQCREDHEGACQSRGYNTKAIGILMVGNFDISYPSRIQWDALVDLVKRITYAHNIPADNIIGHREIYGMRGMEPERSCPGWKFDMDRLRKEVYPGGAEIFTDGARKRYNINIVCDGLEIIGVEPVVSGTDILVRLVDLEKFLPVKTEFHPKLRQIEITTGESDGTGTGDS